MTAIQSYRCALSLLLAGLVSTCVADTVNFDGTLIEDTCEIYPGDEAVELDFSTLLDKYLYLNTRTHSEPFTIRLINCDLAIGREVKVTFSGTASGALPGYLALGSSSTAKGVAIGLEDGAGELLAINSSKYIQQPRQGNNNTLTLKAFVQGEPLALQNKSIQRGAFTATATFTLEYE